MGNSSSQNWIKNEGLAKFKYFEIDSDRQPCHPCELGKQAIILWCQSSYFRSQSTNKWLELYQTYPYYTMTHIVE
jgi:hypothetical protein